LFQTAGFDVVLVHPLAVSAALMSKGFLCGARSQAIVLLNELSRVDPEGHMPIVGLEPSEVYAFKHEVADLLPDRRDEIARRASRTWLVEEFLIRSGALDTLRVATNHPQILFHPHCHQRAEGPAMDGLPAGSDATVALLRACGYDVTLIDAGCCGMAGTFGYEGEHYQLSQRIGSLRLFPRLREALGTPVAATGAACRMQIAQGTSADVQHPIVLAELALRRN
jgi:Fe-S oxidoreductase